MSYDDMVRYADASLEAHHRQVADLQERNPEGSWGAPAMCHRLRLEDWRRAQLAGVHQWAISRAEGAVCTCGLVIGENPMRGGRWHLFFGWLGHLDAETDRITARYVVSGGPYDHVLWCAFCGPINPVRRTATGALDRDDVEDMLERHSHLCPAP